MRNVEMPPIFQIIRGENDEVIKFNSLHFKVLRHNIGVTNSHK